MNNFLNQNAVIPIIFFGNYSLPEGIFYVKIPSAHPIS